MFFSEIEKFHIFLRRYSFFCEKSKKKKCIFLKLIFTKKKAFFQKNDLFEGKIGYQKRSKKGSKMHLRPNHLAANPANFVIV